MGSTSLSTRTRGVRGTELGWAGLSCQEEGFSPCARSMAVGRVVVVGGWRGWRGSEGIEQQALCPMGERRDGGGGEGGVGSDRECMAMEV